MSASMALHVALSLRLDAIEAYRLAHAYRDEVLAGRDVEVIRAAVDSVSGVHQQCHRDPALCAGCQVRADILDVLASVADAIGEKTTATPAATVTPFFQPGHTYTREWVGRRIEFLVRYIDADPGSGARVAFGWRRFADNGWEPANSDDLTGWTDVTEDGGR